MSNDDLQRADHFQHLYEQASEGLCGHSGMPLPVCKRTICDCFEFPWLAPATPTQQGEQIMTAQPTVEDYLAQNTDPEDHDEETFAPLGLDPAMPSYTPPSSTDPLVMMAKSLQTIAAVVARRDTQEEVEDQTQQALNQLDREYAELEALHDAKQSLIEEVLKICKPSTSKLAIAIRGVLEPMIVPPAVEPELDPDAESAEPGPDASVEEWRAFATAFGLEGTDQMNRSQIRTALGIAQPTES